MSQPASRSASRTHLSATPVGDEVDSNNITPDGVHGREFLFFGDVESEYRPEGKGHINVDQATEAAKLNQAIWKQAATSFSEGRLAGIFVSIHRVTGLVTDRQIECSYDASRPAEIMFGHVSPPAIFHELKTLASMLPFASYVICGHESRERRANPVRSDTRPLAGLKIYITHVKELLVPHATGLSARELVLQQLNQLEDQHRLGVEFYVPAPGDRLCTSANLSRCPAPMRTVLLTSQ